MKMLKTLKKIKAYFQAVEVYYNKKIINYKLNKNYKLNIYKSFEQIKDKKIQNYFQDFKHKKKRFDKKQYFITMTFAKRLLSSGWMFKGKNWYVSEIDKEITLRNETVLFDFLTSVGERNKGNYSKLLSLITKRFKGQKLIIYTLQNNLYSKKGILNAGFALKKIVRKI